MLAGLSLGSDKGLLQLYEGFGLFTHMKSALLAAIFAITGGVAILLAVPAEEKAPRRHTHVARPRPNFFEKLVIGFINLQKHQPAKSSRKQSRTTSGAAE